MHARSLLDYLSDAERAERRDGRDARDWTSILERLQELELRLGDLRNASERREAQASHPEAGNRNDLRDEISSILSRRGISPPPRRPSPPPSLAPRDWVEPPPLAPVNALNGPVERPDPNLLKFIEAVRLLGRAADRFMVEAQPRTSDHHPGSARPLERLSDPQDQPSTAGRLRRDHPQFHHAEDIASSRVSDADLLRLWDEVEELRRTLAQLSSRRHSF